MTATLTFTVLALLLLAGTLAGLVPGLWRPPRDRHTGAAPDGGVAILREQLRAVDEDLAAARLAPADAARLRAEIGRRLLDERSDAPATAAAHDGPARGPALALAVGLPVLALALYLALGQPAAWQQPERAVAAGPQATLTQVEAMATQMLQALQAREAQGQAEPGDAGAWAMVGRTLASVQRFAEAEQALARALALRPGDAGLLADRADLLALLQGGSPEGEPMRLIEEALRADPDHPKALALAGSAAWARGDAAGAARHWARALPQLPADSPFARQLADNLAQAQQLAGASAGTGPRIASNAPAWAQGLARGAGEATVGATPPARATTETRAATPARPGAAMPAAGPAQPGAATPTAGPRPVAGTRTLQGRLTLAPALIAQVQPGDTVFIVVRAAQGPRTPLALLRLRAAELPADFTLDDRLAMDPALRLSAFDQVVVSARITRSGEALPRSGDLVSGPVTVATGTRDLVIRIDRVQP